MEEHTLCVKWWFIAKDNEIVFVVWYPERGKWRAYWGEHWMGEDETYRT